MGTINCTHPEVLVTTDWALEHMRDRNLRFIEVDVDTTKYVKGDIEGAIGWNWQTQLQDQVRRDIPCPVGPASKEADPASRVRCTTARSASFQLAEFCILTPTFYSTALINFMNSSAFTNPVILSTSFPCESTINTVGTPLI